MNYRLLIKYLFLAVLVFTETTYSQGGSNYSILGIGDINNNGNAAYSALGGTQIAFPSEISINSRNPAMWSFVTSTRLQAGYKFNQNIVSTEENTLWHNNGNISGFTGIFAIDSAMGISASFGIVPYSNINYLTATKTEIDNLGLKLNGLTTYQGTGGISQAYLGLSTKITNWLGIGGSVFTSFGVVESERKTEFENDYYSFQYLTRRSDYVNGWGGKAGLFLVLTDNFLLGMSYESQPNLTLSRETLYQSVTIEDTTIVSEEDISIPGLFGIGVSYSTGKFIVGADFSIQDFSKFEFNPGANSEFTQSYIASVGINRIGNSSPNAYFADKVSYKFGLNYNQLYYKVLNNQIQEYSASIGAQMPFSGTMILDLSFTLGMRNSGDSRLVNEYFGRFGVDISIGETWFKPFIREY